MELLKQKYNQKAYLKFLNGKFNFKQLLKTINRNEKTVKTFEQLGSITTKDDKELPVFEIHIKDQKLARNRVALRNLVVENVGVADGAIAVFVDDKNNQWRFSFIAIEYFIDENGSRTDETSSKRFTYLLGENTKTRTAKERFELLDKNSSLEDLKQAFAVEQLNKDFYKELYKWYQKAQKQATFPNDENDKNHIQTNLIRLLTRLLFVWFLKEQKLINPDLFILDKLKNIINYEKNSSFYKAILQNLFFATLNRKITDRDFRTTTNGKANSNNYLASNIYRYQNYFKSNDEHKIIKLFSQTPFLNGGLFECLDREATDEEKQQYDDDKKIRPVKSAIRIDGFSDNNKNELSFNNELFFNTEADLGLIDLFNQYQFTIEESTPTDIEIALDPELLGKVFENLLATYNPETGDQARKTTGSFYTPREIVSYMVDESLKQHFKTQTNLTEDQINGLFVEGKSNLQKEEQIKSNLQQQQIKSIINTIDNLKVLDPAVGSGAYPMGVLQRLVFILDKIDHENTYFKQEQLNKAELMEENSKNATIEVIEQIFSTQNQHNAYGKKLMLIENCIYGVDIQPIAIQICKLRFFISLTIEQQSNNNEKDNYGIKALPNLETKFIVANTLLPLGEIELPQMGLFDTGIADLQKQLFDVRHKYFSAKTLTTKRKYKENDQKLRQQTLTRLQESGITPAVEISMKKVVNWDLYNQNAQSDWFDPEWMFGIKDGFDIVIGNPPYIQLQKNNGKLRKLYEKIGFKVILASGDIYQLFYEKGFNLLSKNGHLCYITSNKWMRAKYGEKLRLFFKESTNLKQIIDFEGKQIFENATVDTNILLCGKSGDEKFNYLKQLPDKNNKLFSMKIADLSANAYTLQPPEILALKNKIETIGIPLKDWDIKINYGIKTGFNEAFIINTAKKEELIKADPKSAEIIRPILRGKDIKAYENNWAGLWIIATFPVKKIDIDNYPVIKKHLNQYYPKLKKRSDQGKTPYNLRSCAYMNEFLQQKIVYSEIVQKPQFYFDNKNYYAEATSFIMSGKSLKFLIALLHSNLITYAFKTFYAGGGLGGKGYRYKKVFLEQLPIPKISKTKQQPFIKLVDKIIKAKKDGKDTTDLEIQIDKMVYKLYNLTADEIKIIESSK